MTRLPGLGPKRARRLFDELGIDSLSALRAAAEGQHLRAIKGFGPKFEASMLSSLDAGIGERPAQRVLLHRALSVGEQIVAALRAHPAALRVELAGSARRQADSVKDLDVIATASDPGALARALGELDLIESASAPNENAARGRTHTGLPVDLRVVAPESFGNLLQHFTGSAAHNVALREAAVRRGLHVSEYGILDDETGETLRCATEEEVYERLGLTFPEPELRENRGELSPGFVAPRLVTVSDLKGDLHMHTRASDGRNTIEEMARAALARGYEYIAITDHSATHGFGDHVTPDELERQIERVAEVDERIDGIQVLAGTETNILPDGSPDYDDELLSRLGWVIASVHTSFGMPGPEMTKRMVAAIEHPWIDAIGHPTGRKIQSRQPYALDVDAVIEAAARTGTMLEINSAPDRRDLNDVHAKAAKEAGVMVLIDSDAHGADTMWHVRWGVATARRAWLEPQHVANTRPWPEFAALRKRARRD
jgi:DNA polymerase (family 10)